MHTATTATPVCIAINMLARFASSATMITGNSLIAHVGTAATLSPKPPSAEKREGAEESQCFLG